jgi:tetratricopeptide (TPR) repeat protein
MRTTLQIAVIAIAASLSGCVDIPKPVFSVPDPDVASRSITPEDARVILKNATGTLCFGMVCGALNHDITGIELTDDQVLIFVKDDGDRSHTLPVSALKVREEIIRDTGWVYFTAGNSLYLAAIPAGRATSIASALVVIKNAPSLQEQQATFDTQARAYRDATVKPVPGEGVRRYRVQAEAAVSETRFQDAANLYAKALYITPWWPEGHFNTALILGDLRQYDRAIDHMKKYLALVPNAPDARAAQDRVYVWEGEKAALSQAPAVTNPLRGSVVK